MKIAYFVPYLAPSGPVNVVNYLADELNKEHEIDLFYFKDINIAQFSIHTEKISFFHKIDFDKYDILHSHGVIADAYLWWHSKDIQKAKTITTLHNYVKEDYSYGYNPIKAFLLQRVWNIVTSKHDQVVTLSKDAMEYYRAFWINKNLTYVYNGIPNKPKHHRESTDRIPVEDGYIHIGAIGSRNISKIKGFDQAIRGLVKLPHFSLSIAGGGSEIVSLRALAKRLDLEDRVYFIGYKKDIHSFIESMDIFVVPSRAEGFSLALQEIVKSKKPVACSKIAIFQELFNEDSLGFFELDNEESFASAVQRVWEVRESLVRKAFERFDMNYRADIMAKNYLKVYQNTINKKALL